MVTLMKSFEETFGDDIKECAKGSPAHGEILEQKFPSLFERKSTPVVSLDEEKIFKLWKECIPRGLAQFPMQNAEALKDAIINFAKQLLAQKREVTREEVKSLSCLVMDEYFYQDSMKIITKWLKELGIEVVE